MYCQWLVATFLGLEIEREDMLSRGNDNAINLQTSGKYGAILFRAMFFWFPSQIFFLFKKSFSLSIGWFSFVRHEVSFLIIIGKNFFYFCFLAMSFQSLKTFEVVLTFCLKLCLFDFQRKYFAFSKNRFEQKYQLIFIRTTRNIFSLSLFSLLLTFFLLPLFSLCYLWLTVSFRFRYWAMALRIFKMFESVEHIHYRLYVHQRIKY